MKRFVLTVFLVILSTPLLIQAKLPPKKPFQNEVWVNYLKSLMLDIAPKDKIAEAARITIIVNEASLEPMDTGIETKNSDETPPIWISKGMILEIFTESECAFVLAHELSHVLNKDKPTQIIKNWKRVEDFVLMRRQELKADEDAQKWITSRGYSVCVASRLLVRLAKRYKIYRDPGDPYNKICIERLRLVRRPCLSH